jgi:hypothetical protein
MSARHIIHTTEYATTYATTDMDVSIVGQEYTKVSLRIERLYIKTEGRRWWQEGSRSSTSWSELPEMVGRVARQNTTIDGREGRIYGSKEGGLALKDLDHVYISL